MSPIAPSGALSPQPLQSSLLAELVKSYRSFRTAPHVQHVEHVARQNVTITSQSETRQVAALAGKIAMGSKSVSVCCQRRGRLDAYASATPASKFTRKHDTTDKGKGS